MAAYDWITLGIDVGSRLINGIMAGANSQANFNAQRNELVYNVETLGAQIEGLDLNYDNSVAELTANRDQTIAANNLSLAITGRTQKEQADIASISNVVSQQSLYEQLRGTQEEGLYAIDAAVANAASSGFRNSAGSSTNRVIGATERSVARTYDTQRRQVQLSAYQGYMEAANNYFSANAQMESLRMSNRNANENFRLQLKSLTDEYENNSALLSAEQARYQTQVDELGEWNWGIGVLDFLSGLVG